MRYTPLAGSSGSANLLYGQVDGSTEMLNHAVEQINLLHRRKNTALAYDPKEREWYAFCDHRYGSLIAVHSRYTVTATKLFQFLFYHSFRTQSKMGGKTRDQSHAFDSVDFDLVTGVYNDHVRRNTVDASYQIPDPENPVGFSQLNTYSSTVRNIWSTQVSRHSNNLSWDLIHDGRVKGLMSMVQKRRPRIKQARYDEKVDDHFEPFQSLGQFGGIEEWFWEEGKKTRHACFASLRARFTLLWCYNGVLRSESMFLGGLSDLVDFSARRRDFSDPMEIAVMNMLTGKTIDSEGVQYGRALRHLDPCRCAVGALGIYLLYRFHYSGEMSEANRPDFTKNETWFDIKLLTNGSTTGNTKEMTKRSYTDKMKECFKALFIFSSAFGHWGRIGAPPKMELEEVPQDFIRILGKSVVRFVLLVVDCTLTVLFLVDCQVIGKPKYRSIDIQRKWRFLD